MKQRNAQLKKWNHYFRKTQQLRRYTEKHRPGKANIVLNDGLRRFVVKYQKGHQYRRRQAILQWARLRARDERFWARKELEAHRQWEINKYLSDPGAWWLERARMKEWNFFYYCEYMEQKWGKPNGSYYRALRQAQADRRAVQRYYSSQHYQRYITARRADPNTPNLYDMKPDYGYLLKQQT